MDNQYDLIIVGAGLFGAVVANRAKEQGLRCLVLERRAEAGGNILDREVDGINVHLYGAHIFHTDNERVWRYVNRFATFNNYTHTVLARYGQRLYHLPVGLTTFHEIFGAMSPRDVEEIMEQEHAREFYANPRNLEEKGVSLIGRTIYDLLIKGYTEKQWGCRAEELPPDIIERLPVRRTFDTGYFSDRYQGIPIEGYRHMIKGMLEGVEVRTGVDFLKERDYWMSLGKRVVYTGMVDELMDYCYGALEYRSLEFRTERMETEDYQGMAVINETSASVPYTRTIEHKHFRPDVKTGHTIITREYPRKWSKGAEAYYPVRNRRNTELYDRYKELAMAEYPNLTLGGRLGEYRYLDMDEVIERAMNLNLWAFFTRKAK